MGFEPTTLRDLDHGGSWVRPHLGLGFFLLTFKIIVIITTKGINR